MSGRVHTFSCYHCPFCYRYCDGSMSCLNQRCIFPFLRWSPQRNVSYFTLENYWPDSDYVIFHMNSYFLGGKRWEVETRIFRSDDVNDFFDNEGVPFQIPNNERFDENQANGILWEHPFIAEEGGQESEAAIQSVNEQKEAYREVVNADGETPQLSKIESLRRFLDGVVATKPLVRTYAVGQANLSAWFPDEEALSPIGVFDFGMVENSIPLSNLIAKDFSSEGFVLLSHFDCDHINAYPSILPGSPIYQRTWIAHQPSKSAKQGKMLQLFSRVPKGNWIFLSPGNSYDLGHLKIDVATLRDPSTGKLDPFQSSEENATGVMALVSYGRSILLPGDALYGNFIKSYAPDYCLIPHHSCAYPSPIPKNKMDCSKVEFAHIPVSFTHQYRHPNYSHFSQYKKVGRFIGLGADPLTWVTQYYKDGVRKDDVGDAITEKCNDLFRSFYL